MQGRNQFKIKILFLAGVITAVFCVTPSWSETDAEKMEKAQQEQRQKAQEQDRMQKERAREQRQERAQEQQGRQKERARERQQAAPEQRKQQGAVEQRQRVAEPRERQERPGAQGKRLGEQQSAHPAPEGAQQPAAPQEPGRVRPVVKPVVPHHGPVFTPRPGFKTTQQPDGGLVHLNPATQVKVVTDANHRITAVERPGFTADRFMPDGRPGRIERKAKDGSVLSVRRVGMFGRHVVRVAGDGTRVISFARNNGYVERRQDNRIIRTYVVNNVIEVRVYNTYVYEGRPFYRYQPPRYYAPTYYAWVASPWPAPVYYRWGPPPPYYGYYGVYYEPMPYYPSPAFWLTDFILSAELMTAYEQLHEERAALREERRELEREEDKKRAEQARGITPEMKQLIAEEVRRQIEEERSSSMASPTSQSAPVVVTAPPAAVDPRSRIFVASDSMVLVTATGGECGITPGDIIERTSATPTADGMLPVTVVNSKPGSCPVDTTSTLSMDVLQDMHNQFRAKIGEGMGRLAKQQGQGGMPTGPAPGLRESAEGRATPSQGDSNLISRQQREADEAESDAQKAYSE